MDPSESKAWSQISECIGSCDSGDGGECPRGTLEEAEVGTGATERALEARAGVRVGVFTAISTPNGQAVGARESSLSTSDAPT